MKRRVPQYGPVPYGGTARWSRRSATWHAGQMQTVRLGVVGVGRMGSFHARTLVALAGVELVGVSDAVAHVADAVADELGTTHVPDANDLMEQVDGVVIASPDDTHADLTLAAIDRGVRTLCEKPLATSVADAARVVERERAVGHRLVQVGFMREYDGAHRQLAEQMSDLGDVVSVHAVHRNVVAAPRPLDQVVGQSIVHDIHSVRFMTGDEIVAVAASGSWPVDGSFRHIYVLCTLASGAHAVLEFDDRAFAYEVTLEVVGERGDALTGSPTRAIRRRTGSIDVRVGTDWFARFDEAYRAQDRAWVDSIRRGHAVGPGATDGLRAQVVVESILASLRRGEPVTVPTADAPEHG